ncbi:MAG: hypothetical protein [Bacteriophage sp.]|nr:MAG: hypothetical protein [Bacteriophage sp.]
MEPRIDYDTLNDLLPLAKEHVSLSLRMQIEVDKNTATRLAERKMHSKPELVLQFSSIPEGCQYYVRTYIFAFPDLLDRLYVIELNHNTQELQERVWKSEGHVFKKPYRWQKEREFGQRIHRCLISMIKPDLKSRHSKVVKSVTKDISKWEQMYPEGLM